MSGFFFFPSSALVNTHFKSLFLWLLCCHTILTLLGLLWFIHHFILMRWFSFLTHSIMLSHHILFYPPILLCHIILLDDFMHSHFFQPPPIHYQYLNSVLHLIIISWTRDTFIWLASIPKCGFSTDILQSTFINFIFIFFS